MNSKVCIVIHPITRELVYSFEPGMKKFSADVAKKILEWMSPFRAANIEGVKSAATGEEINGELIMCPLLMEQMVALSQRKVLKRVAAAVDLARERKAAIIGLVAYAALIGERGSKINANHKVPMTTGTHFTLATVPEAILKAVNLLDYNPKKLKVLIYGANPLVYIVLKSLGYSADKCFIYHAKQDNALGFYNLLPGHTQRKTTVLSSDPKANLKDMDIVVNATGRLPAGFEEKNLKSGAIVFDASYPRKINLSRQDVLLIDGVAVEPPGNPKFNFNFGLPEGLCFPCMAEPMTLAFEKQFESYSLGKEFSSDKSDKIYRLALKHGFRIGPLTSHEEIIPPEKIRQVRNSTRQRNSVWD